VCVCVCVCVCTTHTYQTPARAWAAAAAPAAVAVVAEFVAHPQTRDPEQHPGLHQRLQRPCEKKMK
jgi:hypothetical protein